MASVNKWIGIGNLTKDPDQKAFSDGSFVTNITIACNEKYKDKSGEQKEMVEYVNISFFGKLAEIAGKYLAKGNPVYVEGKLKTDKYTDKNGIEKYSTKIIANSLQLLGNKSEAKPKDTEDPFENLVPKSISGLSEMDDYIPF